MGFFKKLFRALSSKKYRRNPRSSDLTDKQFAALNIGAINAEQTSCFCDSLETGIGKKETASNLADYYNVYDSQTAIETLNWLRDEGHRIYFDAIKKKVSGASETIDTGMLNDDQKANLPVYLENLKSTLKELLLVKCLANIRSLADSSILAWDMGRLVLVSRCCSDLGYISETEAWNYINHAYSQCKAVYKDWSDLANGYIIGRAMWNGSGNMLSGIIDIALELLSDDDSPWKKIPLN